MKRFQISSLGLQGFVVRGFWILAFLRFKDFGVLTIGTLNLNPYEISSYVVECQGGFAASDCHAVQSNSSSCRLTLRTLNPKP